MLNNDTKDIFDEIEAEDKSVDVFDEVEAEDDSAEDSKLRDQLASIQKTLHEKELKRSEFGSKKLSTEFRSLLENKMSNMRKEIEDRISKIQIHVEHPIRERTIEKQVIKNIHVPVEVSKVVKEVIKPQIIREIQIERKRDESDKELIARLKEQVETLQKVMDETNRFVRFHAALGGSGVIGIPAPEGNPDNYVLTVIKGKAVWRANAAGNALTPFSIASFSDGFSSPLLIGNGVWKAIGALNFSATYTNGPATSGSVSFSGWGSSLILGNSFQGPTANAEAVNYPSVGGTLVFSLSAGGDNGADTSSISHLFANNRYWGPLNKASGFSASDVTGLSGSDIADSRAKSQFVITAGSGEYLVWASPVRLGAVTFFVGGFEGGFNPPETVSITNANGFTEDYYVYSSINSNLGACNVVTS